LYRSENDKIVGGVCGGLAAYLRIDPAIVRIIFALITFGGFGSGFLLYVILWVVLPSKSVATNYRKRLYRNPESRVIAGVASGLAAYFHIEVWIPRLIFALPLILGIVTSIFRNAWFDFDPGPAFITGGFGGTLFITYIILWVVLPEATTASEKLEMRGERVDLESIKNTIKSDLEGFKGRAGQVGSEIKEKAQQFGQEFKQATQNFTSEAAPVARKTGSGIGHAIGVLFKAFFLFIAGSIAFALIMLLIGLLVSGAGVLPFRNYMLSGFWQNFLVWVSLALFIGIPIIALLTWLIRRIIGARSRNNYLGYAFGSLWVIGLISFIALVGMTVNNFRTKASMEDEVQLNQPAQGKLLIKMVDEKVGYYGSDWFGFNWDETPFYSVNEDSLMMTTVRVNITKSKDSEYHAHRIKFSHGNNPAIAKALAGQIQFDVRQADSVLYLPQGFAITPHQKFRNQQVLIVVEVPVGKRIMIDRNIDDYHWFSVNVNRRHRGLNVDWNDDWNDAYSWDSNVEYVMTNNGLERTDKKIEDQEKEDEDQNNPPANNGYRYKSHKDSLIQKSKKDTSKPRTTAEPAEPKKKEETSRTAAENTTAVTEDTESFHTSFYLLNAFMQ
jgi:phage shock protein PspC (stress-responsive transcriptional regulator)